MEIQKTIFYKSKDRRDTITSLNDKNTLFRQDFLDGLILWSFNTCYVLGKYSSCTKNVLKFYKEE